MNSDCTRIEHSMTPTDVLTLKGKPVSSMQKKQTGPTNNNTESITINVTINNIYVNIFNIPNSNKPVRDQHNNRYTLLNQVI